MLTKFAELGTAHRGDPCQEYPGTYYLYHNGKDIGSFSGEVGEAEALLRLRQTAKEDPREGRFSLGWECSDNDPRVGEVWFTGYFTLSEVRQ